jgi:REP element-mobilizing transposase RayT
LVHVRVRKDGKLARKPGRKPKGKRAGAPHKERPALDPRNPVHVVLRVVDAIRSLRKRHMYKALREATIAIARRELHDDARNAFRIVHISIQRNHIHLIVEAQHKRALSRGMQAFQISAAKHLNRAVSLKTMRAAFGAKWRTDARYRAAMRDRRRGTVFPDRFHQEIITSPKQARHALAYVLPRKPLHALPGFERDFIAERFELLRPLACGFRSRSLRQVVRTEVYKGLVAAQHFVRGDQKLVCDGYECAQGPPASA